MVIVIVRSTRFTGEGAVSMITDVSGEFEKGISMKERRAGLDVERGIIRQEADAAIQ
jgi:peroxiredoxin